MSINKVLGRVGIVLSVAVAVGLLGCDGGDKGTTPPTPPPNGEKPAYSLTTIADPSIGGKIIRSEEKSLYVPGTEVTLTAEANPGYTFIEWTGASTSKNASITVTMNSALSVTAKFRLQETGDIPYNFDPVSINGLTWTKNLNIETADSWCYDDDPANCAIYGRLYAYEAAKSACANMGDGWRLPTREDWNKLVNYAGGSSVAGKKLKSKTGWDDNGNGTDDYGKSVHPLKSA